MLPLARASRMLPHVSPAVRAVLAHSLVFGLALSIADLLFNFYLASLGFGNDVAGTMSTVLRLAGVLFALPCGLLIDRLGGRAALLLGIALYALGWLLMLAGQALWALALAQLLIGAAYTLAQTALSPLLASVTSAGDRAQILGLNASVTLVVGLLGSLVGGLLPAFAATLLSLPAGSVGAYRAALATVVLLALLSALPALRIRVLQRDHPVAEAPPQPPIPLRHLLRFTVGALLLGVGGGAILPFQNLFFRQRFGLEDSAVGMLFALMSFGMGLGAVLGGLLSRRVGVAPAAVFTRMLAGPAVALMALAPDLFASAAGFIARGLLIAASFPLYDSMIMTATPPAQRGLAASLVSAAWSLGWAASAVVAGYLQVRLGFTPILLFAATTYLLSAYAIWTLPEAR